MGSLNAPPSPEELDVVFGPESRGVTPQERATSSQRVFVRSQSQIALDTPEATGMRLKAGWAYRLFGYSVLRDSVFDGAAAVIAARTEPADTLRAQREALGLTTARIARATSLKEDDLVAAETAGRQSPVQRLHTYAQFLGLDEEVLGFEPGARADADLGVRLRRLGARVGEGRLSASLVLKLSEAAWIIARQSELACLLDGPPSFPGEIYPSPDYRGQAWKRGFELAARTRTAFAFDDEQPIASMRAFVDRIGIPLVQAELGETFAGATVANREARGIVVNVQGANSNVWVRRTTIAHELGHLFWDPGERLKRLRVDTYDEIAGGGTDVVEARANAFAIALLAPPSAVWRIITSSDDFTEMVSQVMSRFGLAQTGARLHVANVAREHGFSLDVGRLDLPRLPWPSDEWEANESWTVDFFPVKSVPISRRGRFAALVARAARKDLASLDSAASWLGADVASIESRLDSIASLDGRASST